MILTTGNPIPQNNPKSSYRLTINHMHGDADANTTNSFLFKAKDVDKEPEYGLNLFELIEVLNYFDNLTHGYKCDFCYSSGKRRSLMTAAGFKDRVIDLITDYMESDCTNDGNTLAMFDGWAVTWFDPNGVEHEVNIQI